MINYENIISKLDEGFIIKIETAKYTFNLAKWKAKYKIYPPKIKCVFIYMNNETDKKILYKIFSKLEVVNIEIIL